MSSPASGTPALVTSGVGWIYAAPIGTTEPTSATSSLPAAWIPLGYTDGGYELTRKTTIQKRFVDQSTAPVGSEATETDSVLKVSLAEAKRSNLQLAWGGGAAGVNDATVLNPTAAGSMVSVMLIIDSLATPAAGNVRWIYRNAFPGGDQTLKFQKAPALTLIPIEFQLSLAANGDPEYSVYGTSTGKIA